MTPRQRKIAVPIMAALLLCLAAWWHGFQTVQSFDGISAMRTVKAATGQRLAVVMNQALHVLDDTGRYRTARDAARFSVFGAESCAKRHGLDGRCSWTG